MTVRFERMDDGVRLRTWVTGRANTGVPPLILVHGGPGLPDYLGPVANLVDDLGQVYRYDQRGTGGSTWDGTHTVDRHLRDLEMLLDTWGCDRAVLIGHSFGTDLVSFFVLAHPDRVAGVCYLSGPFLGPWREPTHVTERARRSELQQARLDELDALTSRSEAEEIEFLTLSWLPDHADPRRAWAWAQKSAQTRRPVNYEMNAQLNADKRVVPLERQVAELRDHLPMGTSIIGGLGDPRPADLLEVAADHLGCRVTLIPSAGHEPWLEQPTEFRTALRTAVTTITSPFAN